MVFHSKRQKSKSSVADGKLANNHIRESQGFIESINNVKLSF